MKTIVTIIPTTIGVEFEINQPRILADVVEKADVVLRAPKLNRSGGKIHVVSGDRYFLLIPNINKIIIHNYYLDKVKRWVVNSALSLNVQVEFNEVKPEPYDPYRTEFSGYGFEMVVPDHVERFVYQNDLVEFALRGDAQTVVEVPCGRGKTKSSQKVMVKDPVRTCIIVKPSYMDKWFFDTVKDKTGLRVKSKHVRKANGVDAVVELINLGRKGKLDKERNKVIILPTTTLNLFLKDYCANPTWYDFELRDFFKHLGVGRIIYDEIHEHFLTVYLTGIALNPPQTVEMSATLQPGANKDFIRQRYLERFPLNKRFKVEPIPCVDGRGLYYHIDEPKVLGVVNRMKMYNHNAFEKRLMMNRLMDSYFDMIYDVFKKTMYPKYEKGQKALFLFSLIETCTAFRDYIKRKTKHDGYDFKVVKYNGGDSFDEFLNADIAVSTPGKAGTAVDVYGLANMYITTAIDDRQLNEQMSQRPRPLIEWDMAPKAWFFHCMEIKKHCQYLNSRLNSLQPIMLSFKIADTGYTLRRSNGATARITSSTSAVPRNGSSKLPRTNFSGIPRGRNHRR